MEKTSRVGSQTFRGEELLVKVGAYDRMTKGLSVEQSQVNNPADQAEHVNLRPVRHLIDLS